MHKIWFSGNYKSQYSNIYSQNTSTRDTKLTAFLPVFLFIYILEWQRILLYTHVLLQY